MNIVEAMNDPELFAPWFKGDTWDAWKVYLKAVDALPMSAAEVEIFRRFTGRTRPPEKPVRESFNAKGRRGGGSLLHAFLAVYRACFVDYSEFLQPGERGIVQIVAADRKQARVIFRYISAFLNNVPLLRQLIMSETAERIELTNGIDIEIQTCSFRAVRGYTLVCFVADEVAFWRSDDSANPDHEILNACRPAMATIPNALLLCVSSPYARRGVLWDAYRRHFGKDDSEVLMWQAGSRDMNPTIPESIIQRALEEDPQVAAAEWLAQFRSDVEAFMPKEAVDAAVDTDCFERAFTSGQGYFAFADPAGGSGRDSFTLGIGHEENGLRVLDLVREVKPPFSPERTVAEFAQVLKGYGLSNVRGDRYAGSWPAEQFLKHGIAYEPSELTKSEIYSAFLPLVMSGKVRLLDHQRLKVQLAQLERRTGRGGRDSIDHGPGGNDDVANACAGCLVGARPSGGLGDLCGCGETMAAQADW